MEKATRIAEEEMKRVLRARDLKAYEAREREERWEQDKLQAARKREEEAAQAKEEQRREKERMLARLDAMAAMSFCRATMWPRVRSEYARSSEA